MNERAATEEDRTRHSGSMEDTRRTSAAFEDGKAMEEKNGVTSATDGSIRAQMLRRFFLLTPPPLLAAMFPWDRGGEGHNGSMQGRVAASESGSVMVLLGMSGVAVVVKPVEDEIRWRRDDEGGWSALGTEASSAAAVGAATMALFIGDAAAKLMGKGSIMVTIVKGGTNEVVCGRPWLCIVGQW